MNNLLLNGEVKTDSSDEELRDKILQLRHELQVGEREREKLWGQVQRLEAALIRVRRQLQPLYTALSTLFGDLPESNEPEERQPRHSTEGVWGKWKQKLPGKPAEIIQALLEHGEMSVAQIRVAAHCGQQTVYDVTSKLNKLGLLNKNGGKYSLKQL